MSVIKGSSRKGNDIKGASMNQSPALTRVKQLLNKIQEIDHAE